MLIIMITLAIYLPEYNYKVSKCGLGIKKQKKELK